MGSASDMSHEELEDLLGSYALDALEPDERAVVEAHLHHCPICSAEVDRHHEVTGLLTNPEGEAPAALWDRIADRLHPSDGIETEDPAARGVGAAASEDVLAGEDARRGAAGSEGAVGAEVAGAVPLDQSRRRERLVIRGVSLVASAAVLLAVVLGIQVAHLNHQVGQLRATVEPGLSSAVQSALEEPSTTRVRLVPSGKVAANLPSVTLAVSSSGTAYLIPHNLSKLSSDMTYQLWGQLNGQMISLGLLGADPAVTAVSINTQVPVTLFAITAERAGGVLKPTSTPVVQGPATA